MFESFKDRRERRKIEKTFEPRFKQAAKEASQIENLEAAQHKMDRVSAEANFAFEMLRTKIQKRQTTYLMDEAERLDVDLPAYADEWMETPSGKILSTKGRADLRSRVDAEKIRRREVQAWWWKTILAPALTALTGLIGTIIGLVALLKK